MNKLIKWSRQNISSLSHLPDGDIRPIVERAMQETRTVSFLLVIIPFVVAFTLARPFAGQLLGPAAPGWQHVIVVGLATGLAAGVGGLFGRSLIRKRIQKIANGT